MPERFRRAIHRHVITQLRLLDARFLEHCRAYFGGGTRIVLELGEFRESRDIDFMCADRAGYRALRETISESRLGRIATKDLKLSRDVRADNYGIRTRLGELESVFKFEIVREARIDLVGCQVKGIPVTCLAPESCFAEKLLANADRGLDRSTLSRDIIDLAFMIESWGVEAANSGYAVAKDAYGADVDRKLAAALELLRDRRHRTRCIEGLAIDATDVLAKGLKRLSTFAARRQ
jgi:hypothetical protein